MSTTRKIEYRDQDTLLEGYCAFPQHAKEKTPAVLVFHDWSGRNEFAMEKAEQLAELGYIGFALDMFGKGKLGATHEEKTELMKPLINDRPLLRRRVLAAFDQVKRIETVDLNRIGAIGFCFGGLCALDLGRSGAKVSGIVSFHGLLKAPEHLLNETIVAKILALHGHDDPMVPPEQVAEFQKEMTQAQVDWQIHIYGSTQHAFTNPRAQDTHLGTIYNPVAARRAWQSMKDFFSEIFAQ